MKRAIPCASPLLIAVTTAAMVSAGAFAQSANTTVVRTPGDVTRETTVTGAGGKTATSNTSASWEPGSASRTTTVTGVNGKSATYQSNTMWGDGSFDRSRSGNSRTFSRAGRRRR